MFFRNIAKMKFFCLSKKHSQIQKNQGKNNRVPTFFYVKVFRWTGVMLTKFTK